MSIKDNPYLKLNLFLGLLVIAFIIGVPSIFRVGYLSKEYYKNRDTWMIALCGNRETICADDVCYLYARGGKHSSGSTDVMRNPDGSVKICNWDRAKATGITNEELSYSNYDFWSGPPRKVNAPR